jgi:hypothetical protein
VEHRFYIVSIRIDNKRGVVVRMIWALARLTIVLAAGGQRGFMEVLHRFAAFRLERDVRGTGESALSGLAVFAGNTQFIGSEEIFLFSAHGYLQDLEYGGVEALAGCEVIHHELNVIDQATAMQFLYFHFDLPVFSQALFGHNCRACARFVPIRKSHR